MGLNKSEGKKIYLKIGKGKVVREVEAGTEGAETRVNKENRTVHELKWDSLSGKLKSVNFQKGDKYGNQWILELDDVGEVFTLQLQEDSKYCRDFLCALPNMKLGESYTFNPYDYTNKAGKRKVGLSIKTELAGERVDSFYHNFVEGNGGYTVEVKNGYPDGSKVNWDDEEEKKIYGIKVTKFLREKSLLCSIQSAEPKEKEQDLPF